MINVTERDYKTIITNSEGAETLVKVADEIGQEMKALGLTTNQIRAIFGEVRQIEAQWSIDDVNRQKAYRRLILLKPKMAYRARRERGKGVQELVQILDTALNEVIAEKDTKKQDENFQRFVEFLEAILAYHKAYGGN